MSRIKPLDPVIKWPGSKRSIASTLASFLSVTERSFEPFVGGGALLPFYRSKRVFAGDTIPELIQLWKAIQETPSNVAKGYERLWNLRQVNGHTAYYEAREHFNTTRDPIYLLFLSRTCVNGLIRFNQNGDFNNSLHHTRPGIHPTRLSEVIFSWSDSIKNTHFQAVDYRETLANVQKRDFVFLDPPYAGTHGRYMPQVFDFAEFYKELERLNSLGAQWMLTLDGTAGTRTYHSNVPADLYQVRLQLKTGNSPFTRLDGNSLDEVHESVYLNFQPSGKTLLSNT